MRFTLLGSFATAWLVVACIGKPPIAPGAEVVNFEVSREKLPNGIESVAEQSPDSGTAGVVLVVSRGSADEPAGKAGIAHLTEHLAFQARHDGRSSFWSRLDQIGVSSFNAMTSWDATTYYALVPVDKLPDLLALYAGLVNDPLAGVNQEDFEHERQIVRNEARLRTENGTQGQSVGWLAAETFPAGHPYAHPVAGTRESIDGFSLEDARAFGAAYGNARITVAVSSPLHGSRAQKLVEQAFAAPAAAPRDPGTLAPSLAARTGDGLASPREHRAPVPTPSVWIGWVVPGGFEADGDVAPLVADMVDGTFEGNVHQRDTDIARVTVHFEPGVHASLFCLEVSLNEGRDPVASARSAVRELRHGVADRLHNGAWRQMFKRNASVEHVYAEESQTVRLLHLAASTQFRDHPLFLRERGSRLLAVEADRLSNYLGEHLAPERARAIVVRPAAEGAHGAAGAIGVATRRTLGADLPPPPLAEIARWMKAPGAVAAPSVKLENGLSVIVLPRHGSPFHTLLLGFRGGLLHGSVKGAGHAAIWGRGPAEMTIPSARGAWQRSRAYLDHTEEVIRLTGSNVELSMALLKGMAGGFSTQWPTPKFTEQFSLYTKEYQAPASAIHRRRREALYGAHALGAWPTPEDISNVRANQVYEWKDRVLRPENGVLVIVGDVAPERAFEAARSEFSGWHRSAQRLPALAPPPALEQPAANAEARVLFEHRPQSTQAELALSCVLPAARASGAGAQRLFERMLSERLFTELRMRAAASYSVDTRLDRLWGGTSVLDAEADVDFAKLADVLLVVRRYLELPSATHLDQSSLDRARARAASSYNLSYATTDQLATALFDTWQEGWPLASLDDVPSQIVATKLADVLALSEHCRHNWVLSMLGDETRLRAAWADALGRSL